MCENCGNETHIEVESKSDLHEVAKSLQHASDMVENPFNLLVLDYEPSDPDLQKSLNSFEDKTIKKFSKNLDKHEAAIVYEMLSRFDKYRQNTYKV